jgi:hypothetical protein
MMGHHAKVDHDSIDDPQRVADRAIEGLSPFRA